MSTKKKSHKKSQPEVQPPPMNICEMPVERSYIPPKSRAVQLTEDIEHLNREIEHENRTIQSLREQLHNHELIIATHKINRSEGEAALHKELQQNIPLV